MCRLNASKSNVWQIMKIKCYTKHTQSSAWLLDRFRFLISFCGWMLGVEVLLSIQHICLRWLFFKISFIMLGGCALHCSACTMYMWKYEETRRKEREKERFFRHSSLKNSSKTHRVNYTNSSYYFRAQVQVYKSEHLHTQRSLWQTIILSNVSVISSLFFPSLLLAASILEKYKTIVCMFLQCLRHRDRKVFNVESASKLSK